MTGKNFKQAIIYSIKGLDKDHLANKKFNKFMQKQQKKHKVCTHSNLRCKITKYGEAELKSNDELICTKCGKSWKFNPILDYWSDSFLGVFKKDDNKNT